MSSFEILSLVVTFVCLFSFCIVFTILFRNYNLNAIKDVKEGKEDIAGLVSGKRSCADFRQGYFNRRGEHSLYYPADTTESRYSDVIKDIT